MMGWLVYLGADDFYFKEHLEISTNCEQDNSNIEGNILFS